MGKFLRERLIFEAKPDEDPEADKATATDAAAKVPDDSTPPDDSADKGVPKDDEAEADKAGSTEPDDPAGDDTGQDDAGDDGAEDDPGDDPGADDTEGDLDAPDETSSTEKPLLPLVGERTTLFESYQDLSSLVDESIERTKTVIAASLSDLTKVRVLKVVKNRLEDCKTKIDQVLETFSKADTKILTHLFYTFQATASISADIVDKVMAESE
jgi:hypothetical protein